MEQVDKKERSKEKILGAALAEFGARGYSEASTNQICKNNEISKGLLFHYYKSKDDLFLACVEKCFEDLVGYTQTHYRLQEPTIEGNLTQYFQVRQDFFLQYPLYLQVFKAAIFNTPPQLAGCIKEKRQLLHHMNQQLLERMLEMVPLKEAVNRTLVIQTILDFADYLLMHRTIEQTCSTDVVLTAVQERNEAFIEFVQMMCYGIVASRQ